MSDLRSRVNPIKRVSNPEISSKFLQIHRNIKPESFSEHVTTKLLSSIGKIELNKYPDLYEFRQQVAELVNLPENQVNITSGVDGAIRDALDVFCQPGDKIAFLAPCYLMYRVYAEAYNLEAIEIKCKPDLSYDFVALRDLIKSGSLRLLFIGNPQSPVDFSLSKTEFEELLNLARNSGTLLFVDEAYHYFGAPTFLEYVNSYDNVMVARSFSKAFALPSIRLGLLCAGPALSSLFGGRRLPYEANSFTISIASLAMDNQWIKDEYVADVSSQRQHLKEFFEGLGLVVHGAHLNSIAVTGFGASQVADLVIAFKENGIIVKTFLDELPGTILFTLGNEITSKRVISCF